MIVFLYIVGRRSFHVGGSVTGATLQPSTSSLSVSTSHANLDDPKKQKKDKKVPLRLDVRMSTSK
jgi:hypothetical protein